LIKGCIQAAGVELFANGYLLPALPPTRALGRIRDALPHGLGLADVGVRGQLAFLRR
jgi:hypothetical protein